MAPFRSSRSTRNNDPATLNRGRGGVIDHDPTEGLPVRNWYLGNINVKQDEPAATEEDQQPSANTINPDYPWPELRLPSFYSELPPLSQQIVRVARSGRPVKPSVYDKKTGTYISHAEYSARNTLKSKHLENVGSPAAEDDEEIDEDPDVKAEMVKQERAFAMRKWAQIPPAVADRRPEPKYLADRRPGMRSLYGLQAAALNPALNSNATSATTANFDLGDGSGLGNATGVLAAGADKPPLPLTPVKRMPPKRKKKGGPGRKKANMGSGLQLTNGTASAEDRSAEDVQGDGAAGQALDGSAMQAEGDTHMDDAHDGEDDKGDDGSGSDEEGSEEGEIEETQPHDTEMKIEDVVPMPATEPPQPDVPFAVATSEEVAMPTEPAVAEIEAPVIEEVESTEMIPVPVLDTEECVGEPVPMPVPVLVPELVPEPVEPAPAASSAANVDILGGLDDAVADMEKKED